MNLSFSRFRSPCCSATCFHLHVDDAVSPFHRLECQRCGAVFHLSVAFMPLDKPASEPTQATPPRKPLNQHFTTEGFPLERRKHWFELQREKYFDSIRQEHWISTGRYLRPPGTPRKPSVPKSTSSPLPTSSKTLKELLDELN